MIQSEYSNKTGEYFLWASDFAGNPQTQSGASILGLSSDLGVLVHFFNYYGFYIGSFYPGEYLQSRIFACPAGQTLQLESQKRLKIARELIAAGLHDNLRNLRYRDLRGSANLIAQVFD